MSLLTDEQPPKGLDPDVAEYIARMFRDAALADDQHDQFSVRTILPEKISVGKLYYFLPITGTPIVHEGFWWYDSDGIWRSTTMSDIHLEIPKGNVADHIAVNKFGYAPAGAQITGADIWDRADAVPTQSTWTAPLSVGQQHNISSTSAADDADLNAAANFVRVWGLTDWDSPEVFEDIRMNGTANVLTVNSYVIIHRMSVIDYGIINTNAGIITARVSGGIVITAQINIGWGQTEMAIYGIPSTQTVYMPNWYASVQKSSGTSADCNFRLMYSQDPFNSPSLFVTKEIRGLQSDGSSNGRWPHAPYKKFVGPGILKIRAYSSANDLDVTGGFDLILVNN